MNSLKKIWTKEEIDIIYSIFKYAISREDDKQFYIELIEKIIDNKEKILNEYVKEVSTQF